MTAEAASVATITEIEAYIQGWQQRYYDLQDLFIVYGAMPTYQTQCKHPPKYEDFVKNRENRGNSFSDMTYEELLAFASDDDLRSDG